MSVSEFLYACCYQILLISYHERAKKYLEKRAAKAVFVDGTLEHWNMMEHNRTVWNIIFL
jgi:hypothetical protein